MRSQHPRDHHHHRLPGAIFWCLVALSWPLQAWPQEQSTARTKTFSFYWENDSVTGSDQDYSNGLKLTWSQPYTPDTEKHTAVADYAFRHLPFARDEKTLRATAFSLGQYIYTPKDTDRSDLIVNDRPYAGYSFMGFGFLSQTASRRDVWEVDIGIVGPWSLAENAQNSFHDLIRTNRARGWDHQLGNEPGLELIYEAKWRSVHAGQQQGWGVDLIPHVGAQLGNIATTAKSGGELRFGWSIPQDFGTCPIRPGCDAGNALDTEDDGPASAKKIGFYLFVAVEGRAVLRDIFLDGNTWQKCHSVDKEIYVAELMGGLGFSYGRYKLSYAWIRSTPEFKQRKDDHAFGTINFSFAYK